MSNHYDNATRWLDIASGKSTKSNYTSGNLFGRGDVLYSYGTHFEVARIVRDKAGMPELVLLNGDRYSVTTNRHQATARSVVQASGLPAVIIPYAALSSAGIRPENVKLGDRSSDRTIVTKHTSKTIPEGASYFTHGVHGYVALTAVEVAEAIAKKNAEAMHYYEQRLEWAKTDSYFAAHPPRMPEPLTELDSYSSKRYEQIGTETVLCFNSKTWRPVKVSTDDDGSKTYSWETSRHWLGESVIQATISTSVVKFCKACNRAKESRRQYVACDHCEGNGRRYTTVKRTAYYLSGFDHNESRPSYFLCELPKGAKPTTVEEAYECLKPAAVTLAERLNRPVARQGDIFAISLAGADKRALRKKGARFEKRGTLLGTNHVASEVAYMPDGTTLARGVLHHVPQWRGPDHRRVRLTEGWSVIVKNTVPLSK